MALCEMWESGWTTKPCPVCGKAATSHAALFSVDVGGKRPDERPRPIGEAFKHEDTTLEDCVRPEELARAIRGPSE